MDVREITLLYYSAHSLPGTIEANIRARLPAYRTISVTQKPIVLGQNICVGEIGKSHYNCYRQIYTGLQFVETPYVAMVEDDTLYPKEHFQHRPETISYNKNMWFLEHEKKGAKFWHKGWTGMFACIAPTQKLLKILERRFKAAPQELLPRKSQRHSWKEPPGTFFETQTPIITLNYYGGLDGKKNSRTNPATVCYELPCWGGANELYDSLIVG